MRDSHFFMLFCFILVFSLNDIPPAAGFPQLHTGGECQTDIPTLAHHHSAFSESLPMAVLRIAASESEW
jgi:hypothetical protein